MRRLQPTGQHGAYPFKTSIAALLIAALTSCSSEDAGLSAIKKIAKEKVKSAFGAGLAETGSATVDVNGDNLTVSVSGKSSSMKPSKPPGGEIVFSTEGVNDVTFRMTARESVAEVEKFYRASFARDGFVERDMTSAGGLFKGEWARKNGKPGAYVYVYEEGGRSHLAVTLVKR